MSVKYYFLSVLFIFLTLLILPVVAANNYLFPSDIIEQAEPYPYPYENEREGRYAEQRQWIYPETLKKTGSDPYYSKSEQYISVVHDPISKRQTFQKQNYRYYSEDRQVQYLPKQYLSKQAEHSAYKSDPFSQSERYKYSNLKSNNSQTYRYPGNNNVVNTSGSFKDKPYYYEPNNYKPENYKPYNYNSYESTQQNVYPALSQPARQIRQKRYNRSYPELVYPGDMETRQRFTNNNKYVGSSDPSYRDDRQIQYVPVPVYTVPGTLPGTVPGVVTPGNMVPGYSHLSPQKNNSNPFFGQQFNPFTGMGLFPGGSNPFDSFYKTYGSHSKNISPFASPESMFPGSSIPNMFSSQ